MKWSELTGIARVIHYSDREIIEIYEGCLVNGKTEGYGRSYNFDESGNL